MPINSNITCPFCHERDFDKIGLKFHLENYCKSYKDTGDRDSNPCIGCEYRELNKLTYINVCLLDKGCIRDN